MKRWKIILGGLLLLLLAVQFIPVNLPEVAKDNPGDIMKSGLVSQEVANLLKNSCYSCHSNETVYPWYSYVAPSSWLVKRDVMEAREELNFSTWSELDQRKMIKKLDDIASEVGEGNMPMPIYTLIHGSAKLNDTQRQLIVTWTEAAMDSVAEADSEAEEQ
jgi:Haem-binding domain